MNICMSCNYTIWSGVISSSSDVCASPKQCEKSAIRRGFFLKQVRNSSLLDLASPSASNRPNSWWTCKIRTAGMVFVRITYAPESENEQSAFGGMKYVTNKLQGSYHIRMFERRHMACSIPGRSHMQFLRRCKLSNTLSLFSLLSETAGVGGGGWWGRNWKIGESLYLPGIFSEKNIITYKLQTAMTRETIIDCAWFSKKLNRWVNPITSSLVISAMAGPMLSAN